jgi:FkbM family methyltransferase
MISSIYRIWKFFGVHPLTRSNRVAAMKRFIRWQIGSRVLGAPALVPFIGETVMVVEPGMTGATGNVYCGLHEFEDMALLLHVLRKGDRFVDIGANIGSYSILAAGVRGSQVFAFEPVPQTFAKLVRNLRVNGIESLAVGEQVAAGEASGVLKFTADRDTMNQVAPDNYTGRLIEVPVRCLDEMLAEFPAVMWKVDVEGFEEQVLRGAAKVLRHPELRVVLLEGSSQEITSTMEDAGFARATYEPWTRAFCLNPDKNLSNNNLWIRQVADLTERCISSPRFSVLGMSI